MSLFLPVKRVRVAFYFQSALSSGTRETRKIFIFHERREWNLVTIALETTTKAPAPLKWDLLSRICRAVSFLRKRRGRRKEGKALNVGWNWEEDENTPRGVKKKDQLKGLESTVCPIERWTNCCAFLGNSDEVRRDWTDEIHLIFLSQILLKLFILLHCAENTN